MAPNWHTFMHCRHPLHLSGSFFATYSARNITGKSCVTVAFIAMQSERSQLQRADEGGVEGPHRVAEPLAFVLAQRLEGFLPRQNLEFRGVGPLEVAVLEARKEPGDLPSPR